MKKSVRLRLVAIGIAAAFGGVFGTLAANHGTDPQAQVPSIGGFSLVVSAQAAEQTTPKVSSATAVNASIANFGRLKPGYNGYTLKGSTFHSGVREVLDARGHRVYSSSSPADGYLLVFTAPGQHGYRWVGAISFINGSSGKVEMSQQFAGDTPLF